MGRSKRVRYGSEVYWEQRNRVYDRDKGRCQSPHCVDKPDYSLPDKWDLDHIIPISRGGNNDDSNLRCLCKFCHLTRSDPSHARLRKRYTVTGRLKAAELEKFLWDG